MNDEVRLPAADLRKSAITTPVSMQGLWRLVLWGATAVTAMLIAVTASRSVVGSQRAAVAMVSLKGGASPTRPVPLVPTPVVAQRIQSQDETLELAADVRKLAVDDDDLKSRLAALEQNMADLTGSIARQAATARTAPPPPWPSGPAVPATPESIAAVVAPALPMPMEYGVDIGSGLSIQALRARWVQIRAARPQLFNGLAPTVTLHETRRSNSPELRLVVGPLQSAEAATRLCAALQSSKLFCEPTIFAGQHLALD